MESIPWYKDRQVVLALINLAGLIVLSVNSRTVAHNAGVAVDTAAIAAQAAQAAKEESEGNRVTLKRLEDKTDTMSAFGFPERKTGPGINDK